MSPCAFCLQYMPCSPSSRRFTSPTFHHTFLSPIGTRWKEARTQISPSNFRRDRCRTAKSFAAQGTSRDPDFAPGTTTLLLQVSEPAHDLLSWTHQWLRDYIFSAKAPLTVPVSLRVDDKEQCQVLFYASDSEVRGLLLISVESEEEHFDIAKLRITSSSRFVNAAGTYTSTLPGERRIVRDLYSSIAQKFNGVRVLYKPRYVRLRKNVDCHGSPSAHATVLVCEVRNVSRTQLVSSLHDWAFEVQFSAAGLSVDGASLPPISVYSFRNGVKVRSYQGRDAELIAYVRAKGTGIGRAPGLEPGEVFARPSRSIVVVSATYPNEKGTRVILRSLSTRLLRQFADTRIHTPSRS